MVLGVIILWVGWMGFNPASFLNAVGSNFADVAVNTNLAAAAGVIGATIFSLVMFRTLDVSQMGNGAIAGLVAITAPCAFVGVGSSIIIGLVAGVLVVYAVLFFDRVKIDDPVGALSVHLVNGAFGTLCVGLFASDGGLFFGGGMAKTISQLIGIAAVGATTFSLSMVAWLLLKTTVGIRVSKAEEIEGLDAGEHDMEAYGGFAMNPAEMRSEVI
jgi:Amt family ammonium transporter